MAKKVDIPSTEETLQEVQDHGASTPAELAVVKQEEDLKSGAENPG